MSAFINHGRWLDYCPVCGAANIVQRAEPEYICAACNPAVSASRWEIAPDGNMRLVADVAMRAYAAERARARGETRRAEFPKNAEKIEKILRKRPEEKYKNWDGESLAELERENRRIDDMLKPPQPEPQPEPEQVPPAEGEEVQ